MSLRFGLREADIVRRETSIVSWLDFREHMTGRELAGLFSEWTIEPYSRSTSMLTELALTNLVRGRTVQQRVIETPGSTRFPAFRLASQSVAEGIDPNAVELAPREVVLMEFMDRRNEPQTAVEFDKWLGQQTEPDSWRTQACLGHLAKLGLLLAVENPPGAYRLA